MQSGSSPSLQSLCCAAPPSSRVGSVELSGQEPPEQMYTSKCIGRVERDGPVEVAKQHISIVLFAYEESGTERFQPQNLKPLGTLMSYFYQPSAVA